MDARAYNGSNSGLGKSLRRYRATPLLWLLADDGACTMEVGNGQPADAEAAPAGPMLPMLASACPGWVCYAEKTQGAWVLPHISSAKSPQAVQGCGARPLFSGCPYGRKWRVIRVQNCDSIPLGHDLVSGPRVQVARQAVAGAAAGQEAERRVPLRRDAVLRQEVGGVPRGLPAARYLVVDGPLTALGHRRRTTLVICHLVPSHI